jgi:hypothetical protein
MSDDLTTLFLQKLQKLKDDIANDALNPLKYIENLEKWLAGDRSLQQHRLCQKYLTYLWQSYGENYKSRDGFVMWIKFMLGYADIKERRFKDKAGSECRDRIISVKSLAFSACTQREHNEFFNNLKQFSLDTWGIEFDLWYEEFSTNPDLIQ